MCHKGTARFDTLPMNGSALCRLPCAPLTGSPMLAVVTPRADTVMQRHARQRFRAGRAAALRTIVIPRP